MSLVQLFEWVDDSRDLLTVLIGHVQEVYDFTDGGVLEDEHMLGKNLNESEEASFGIVPGISVDLLLDGLQRFDDSTDTELEIEFGAVERTNDQIDNAKVVVIDHFLDFLFGCFFLFDFKPSHDVFSLFIKVDHDVAHTQVSDDNCC